MPDPSLERVLAPASNGHDGPTSDDLDGVLFASFPQGSVSGAELAASVPAFDRALGAATPFDHELLFVRLLECAGDVPADARDGIARTAAERLLSGGFAPDDAISVVRFLARAHPDAAAVFERVTSEDALGALRFGLTLDFVLDHRELDDYLALSYLREADADSRSRLEAFPVQPAAREALERLFTEESARARLRDGWTEFTEEWERPELSAALSERMPGLAL